MTVLARKYHKNFSGFPLKRCGTLFLVFVLNKLLSGTETLARCVSSWISFDRFDTADVAVMVNDGSIKGVILHERGHIIGIGTLWGRNGVGANNLLDTNNDYRLCTHWEKHWQPLIRLLSLGWGLPCWSINDTWKFWDTPILEAYNCRRGRPWIHGQLQRSWCFWWQ